MEVKYIKEEEIINANAKSVSVFNVRMMRDIEVSGHERDEYMRVNSEHDQKKAILAVAKIKWKNMIESVASPDKDLKDISEKSFKFNL